jgi:hypothetical protein
MNPTDKVQFEALDAFRGRLWQEYEDKSKVEWRFSYSLWATLLAASGVVVANNATVGNLGVSGGVAFGIAAVATFLEAIMLCWIHKRLCQTRQKLQVIDAAMVSLLHINLNNAPRGMLGIIAPILELLVTTFLAILFAILLCRT